jgi:hypothetical protein
MRDVFELGTTTPHDEPCSQVGDHNFQTLARMEAKAFINQMYRIVGEGPGNAYLKTISCPHDFGSYIDVAVSYNDSNEDEENWMLECEANMPCKWDEQAIKELTEAGYFQLLEASKSVEV